MLSITIPRTELWDSSRNIFETVEPTVIDMEHSLASIAEWEGVWHKAFFGSQRKTDEEVLDYIRRMTLTPNVPGEVYMALSPDNYASIGQYMKEPSTSVYFPGDSSDSSKGSGDTLTAELIYYLMISLGIPFECQYWHINRLFALIRVCDMKNSPKKTRSNREILQANAALNAERQRRMMERRNAK